MPTSFQGWGTSWGDSWGAVETNPGSISGSASFSISAAGSLTVAQAAAGGSGRAKRRRDVLKDIKRLNELILRCEIDTPIITIQPYDETDDEEALMLLL